MRTEDFLLKMFKSKGSKEDYKAIKAGKKGGENMKKILKSLRSKSSIPMEQMGVRPK